jgi:hypothetical protein
MFFIMSGHGMVLRNIEPVSFPESEPLMADIP